MEGPPARSFRLVEAQALFWVTFVSAPAALGLLGDRRWFFWVAAGLLVINLGIALLESRSRVDAEGQPIGVRVYLGRLLTRLKRQVYLAISGGSGLSWYTLALFLGVGLAFFAWFADGLELRQPYLWAGALFYVLALVLASDLVYLKLSADQKPKRRTLVTWSSRPHPFNSRFDPSEEEQRDLLGRYADRAAVLEALRKNRITYSDGRVALEKVNFFPVLAVLAHPEFQTVERLDVLVASDTERLDFSRIPPEKRQEAEEKWEAAKAFYWELFRKMATALRPDVDPNKFFNVVRVDVESSDVNGMKDFLRRRYDEALKKKSGDFVFNLTGGTSTMSAATILVALRGVAEGVYLKQAEDTAGSQGGPPLWERVVTIRIGLPDVLELLEEEALEAP